MITDQYTDKSFKLLYKIAEKGFNSNLETELRKMSVCNSEKTLTKLGSDKFADQHNRMFPIDTKENVLLSKVYFDYQESTMEPKLAHSIDCKLNTYLDLHSIPEEFFTKPSSMDKTASSEKEVKRSTTYLLPEHNIGAVTCKSDLEKLSSSFEKDHTNLSMADRVKFAQNFIKCTSEFEDVHYSNTLAKYASLLDTDLANTSYLLKLRAGICHVNNKDGSSFTKLATLLDQVTGNNGLSSLKSLGLATDESRKSLTKLAETIQKLDEQAGLDQRKYDSAIPDSFSSVFNLDKLATDAEEKTKGEVKEKEPSKAEVISLYGEDVLEEVEDEDGDIDQDKLKEIEKLVQTK